MVGKGLLVARISQKSQPQVQVDDYFLIALAKGGDRTAYDRIVRRYYGFVRLKASSYFLAGGDADDLVQEGLVGLYKAVRDYRSDRESSFRNFAELCITRQIITAVKTATRNKHTPLNQYVSFSVTPAGAAGVNGPRPRQPGHLLRGAALARRLPLDGAVGARVARSGALPRRPPLRGGRDAPGLRRQDGRQRAAARQAQGRHAPHRARRAELTGRSVDSIAV
jgi:RNA polymerase sigma factor (sigma-70 family)